MRFLLTAVLLLSASASFATELLRMKDGYNAVCAEKYDVLRSKANNVYNLRNPKLTVNEVTIQVELEINFFECVEKDGKFSFKKLDHHMSASYTYPDLTNGGVINATRIDKEKHVLAVNDQYSIVGKSEILKKNNQFYVLLTIEKSDLEINQFPMAQEKGAFYTTLMLRTLTKVVTPTIDLGFSYVGSGAYRLFLDLEKAQASF